MVLERILVSLAGDVRDVRESAVLLAAGKAIEYLRNQLEHASQYLDGESKQRMIHVLQNLNDSLAIIEGAQEANVR